MQRKRKLDTNGYTYNKFNQCENPTGVLSYSGKTFVYSLAVSECYSGWLFGFSYIIDDEPGIDKLCSLANGLHPNKKMAELCGAELLANMFHIDDVISHPELQALRDFLTASGSIILPDAKIPSTDMAKQTNGDKPKRTKIITTPMGINQKKQHDDEPPAADKGPGKMIFVNVAIKDGFCNYSYQMEGGKADGFIHKVDGKGIVENDFNNAFQLLNVHLAIIDEVFKHNSIDITNFHAMHAHELTYNYSVTGFKITGGEENEAVILLGNKYLGTGDRMELKTPKTMLNNHSSYKWYEELLAAVNKCKEEAQRYHDGNYTLPMKKEKKSKKDKSGDLFSGQETGGDHDQDSDFDEDNFES